MKNTHIPSKSIISAILLFNIAMPSDAQQAVSNTDLINPNINAAKSLKPLTKTTQIHSEDAANSSWELCSPWVLPEPIMPEAATLDRGAAQMSAYQILAHDETLTSLSGDVYIQREHDFMQADYASYLPKTEFLDVSGNLHYQTQESLIYAESARFSTLNESGLFSKAEFFFKQNHISGYAELLEKNENSIVTLTNTSYSTCDPDKLDWKFQAKKIRLDENKGFASAKHMRIYFKRVPIFYAPYLTFPINDTRKSGFLFPKIGSSNNRGTEVMLPYYWNIAPQADSTIAVHNMTKRGTQLATQWRYMSQRTYNQLHLEYLDDQKFEDTRSLLKLNHSGRLPLGWGTSINFVDISDSEYYIDSLQNDLSASYLSSDQNNLNLARLTSVARTVVISKPGENWNFSTTYQDFLGVDQFIGSDSLTYSELPKVQLLGRYIDLPGSIDFEFNSTLTSFTHKTKNDARRLDIYPSITRIFGTPGWYIKPKASYRYTQYLIDNPDDNDPNIPANEASITRSLPIISIDNGLVFERFTGKSKQYYQTLEPRVFFAYVPFRPQSDIPLYDTYELGFNFPQLFHDNIYTGPDRIQDTNHASVALSTEISDSSTGEPIFRTSIGRILYLKDRQVTLRDDSLQTEQFSNIVSETMFAINQRWSTNLEIEWNSDTEKIIKTTARLYYKRDNNHIVNFGYRFSRDQLEQSELVWRWPLSRRWTSVAKWQYSLHEIEREEPLPADLNTLDGKHDIETFLGLEYESCCYIFRAIGRRFLKPQLSAGTEDSDLYETEILLQFSFKGFTSFGNDANELLIQKVRGYQKIDY